MMKDITGILNHCLLILVIKVKLGLCFTVGEGETFLEYRRSLKYLLGSTYLMIKVSGK